MEQTPLILASGSPRRQELMEQMNYRFQVIKSDIEEVIDENLDPHEVVMDLALQKAKDISKKNPNCVVLGADTIVTYNNLLLGKPADADEAYKTLMLLSGQTHQVLTGVAICKNEKVETFYERTEVTFWDLDQVEIDDYIKTKDPFDKAGSYGIQGVGAHLVKGIKGDYFSVVGLPIAMVVRKLRKYDVYPIR